MSNVPFSSPAQNYGGSDKTYEQGDFTGDGIVNFTDLLKLAQSYGQSLPPPLAQASLTDSTTAAARRSVAASILT